MFVLIQCFGGRMAEWQKDLQRQDHHFPLDLIDLANMG